MACAPRGSERLQGKERYRDSRHAKAGDPTPLLKEIGVVPLRIGAGGLDE